MSTWISKKPGQVSWHFVDVPETTSDLVSRSHALIEHAVQWPHMWRPGDRVEVTLADGDTYPAACIAGCEFTKKVLIELL